MKKLLSGRIIKIIDDNTAKVSVLRYVRHPKYEKKYRITKNYLVHTEKNQKLEIGSKVTIQETKPISKNKNWRIA